MYIVIYSILALQYTLLLFVLYFRELVERLCDSIDRYGPDCWWEYSVRDLIGLDIIKKLNIDPDDIVKGNVNFIKFSRLKKVKFQYIIH